MSYKQILAAYIVKYVYQKYCAIYPDIETSYEGEVTRCGDSVRVTFKNSLKSQIVKISKSAILSCPLPEESCYERELKLLAEDISNDIVLKLAQSEKGNIFVFQCVPDDDEQDNYILLWALEKRKTHFINWLKN